MTKIFYTYMYLDSRKPGRFSYENLNASFLFEPLYVGKGKNARIDEHLIAFTGNQFLHNKIRRIQQITGDHPYRIKVIKDVTEADAYMHEAIFIERIGRIDMETGPLVNLSDGGIGHINRSEDVHKKIAAGVRKYHANNPRTEKQQAHYKRFSALLKEFNATPGVKAGKNNPQWGKDHSGSKNGHASNSYILYAPNGIVHIIEKGGLYPFTAQHGLSVSALTDSAKSHAKTGTLWTIQKSVSTQGWSARFAPSDNSKDITIGNQQPSLYKGEGSTTRAKARTLQAIGSGNGEHLTFEKRKMKI